MPDIWDELTRLEGLGVRIDESYSLTEMLANSFGLAPLPDTKTLMKNYALTEDVLRIIRDVLDEQRQEIDAVIDCLYRKFNAARAQAKAGQVAAL